MSKPYSKTAKGQEEIKTRAGGLTQRMRQMLIFIDGKRSRDDLAGMLKGDDIDELLGALAAQGLIEASASTAPKAAPAATASAAVAVPQPAPKSPPPSPKAPPPPQSAAELERKRREEEEQVELLMARSFMGKMS